MDRTERRVVTVLFADLVGFTSLSEKLDPEDIALVQQEYFVPASEILTRHGGRVEKFIGDAVVGAFGVPHARDDEPIHAIRAGVRIVDAVAAAERKLSLAPGTLQVRVGINTGEVVVVRSSSDEDDWRLAGDVVNTAARLQTAAEPGTVVVGSETAFGAAHAFVLERARPVALKGKAASTPVWRVVRERAVPSRESALHGLHADVVGRDHELARLDRAHQNAASGPRAVLVVAPPGVGKTRLVREFRDRTVARGGTVWWSRVTEGGGTYDAIADLVRNALATALTDPDPQGRLRDRLGSATPRARLSVDHTLALLAGDRLDADPDELWTSWTAMLDAHSEDDAPVWVIEDLHLASADLRGCVRHATAHAYRSGRLIVLTARPVEYATLEDDALGPVEVLDLAPLEPGARLALVDQLVGHGVLPADVTETITDTSGGNPLFIEELLRSWVHSGALRRDDEQHWRFDASTGRLSVPSTVWAIYLGQLDDLPAEPRGVVESGSVPGTTFPSHALAVLGAADAEESLDFLTAFGILAGPHPHDVDAESYTYRHALLRDAAYGSMPRTRRADLHRRFADWLVARGRPERVAELVGNHLALAHQESPTLTSQEAKADLAHRAAEWLEQAGDNALVSAPHRAAESFERARDLGDPSGDDWARRQSRMAEAWRRSGRLEDALRAFAAVPPNSPHVIDAALGYEDALFASRLSRDEWGAAGRDLLAAALDRTPEHSGTRARLLAAQARADIYRGAVVDGMAAAQAALDSARAVGDARASAEAFLAWRASQGAPEHLDERITSGRQMVEAARRAGDLELEVEGLRLLFVDLLEGGDVEAADDTQRRAEELVIRLGRPLFFWYPPMWRAMRVLLAGDFDAAAGLIEQFRDEGTRWHYQQVDLVHAVQVFELHAGRGRPELALPVLRTVQPQYPERFGVVLADALVRLGQPDEARDLLASMTLPDDQSRAYILALAAETAASLGDIDLSARLRRELDPWAGHNIVLGAGAVCLGSASHYLGLVARAAGDDEASVAHLWDAVRMNDALGAAPAAARSRAELDRI